MKELCHPKKDNTRKCLQSMNVHLNDGYQNGLISSLFQINYSYFYSVYFKLIFDKYIIQTFF